MKNGKRLLALLCLSALCACQPTPEQEAVVNRADGALEAALAAPAQPEAEYDAPARWEEAFTLQNGVEVRIDADIELGEGARHPVYTIERGRLTGEQALALLNGLFPGDLELRVNRDSREELLYDMRRVRRGYFVDVDEESGEVIYAPYEDETEQLAALQQRLSAAPEQDAYAPLEAEDLAAGGGRLAVRAAGGQQYYVWAEERSLCVSTSRQGTVQSETAVLQGGYAGEARGQGVGDVLITEEEAVETARAALARAGLAGSFAISHAEKARMLEFDPDELHYTGSVGYVVYAGRSAEGYAALPYGLYSEERQRDGGQEQQEEPAYAQPWFMDVLYLYVTQRGVEEFCWDNMNRVLLTANENVALLEFSKVQERIRSVMKQNYSYAPDNARFAWVEISRIALTLAIDQMPDQGDEALLCPVWAVICNDERGERVYQGDRVLLINALDGSVVRQWP